MKSTARPHILFVTGKLAEPSLRSTVQDISESSGFTWSIAVLPITVAALATCDWIGRHLKPPSDISRVVIPGLCAGAVETLADAWKIAVDRGPNDLRDLPEYFGGTGPPSDYGAFDIEILAEINHAPRLRLPDLLAMAKMAQADGADVIDLGCDPGATWSDAATAVRFLRDEGLRVSIDTFNPVEAASATRAGAELVLSVNSSNAAAAADWGCEVVVVPDVPQALDSLDATVGLLQKRGVPFRIDPVLEPIGFGFAASLGRYLEVRKRYPEVPILMGVGNLTELTDVDSAGVNVLLLGFCQEARIKSVLTTEVINWCRSSVRELDRARRLVYHAVTHRVLPKRLEPGLVMLRDPKIREHGEAALRDLATGITDRNYRLFAERGLLHVLNGSGEMHGEDPFALFRQMLERDDFDPAHAFYLGYEMAKAVTALTLGKNYVQDQALQWGMLTRSEKIAGK
jgi:dihydropteroate synthase-like protein